MLWTCGPLRASFEVRCPRCGTRARFEEPFEFISSSRTRPRPPGTHQWGGWYVREKFPSVVRWKPPRGVQGHRLGHVGVVRCPACHLVARHVLRWPEDAFFQWQVRGERLWAWDAEHALVLLDYVRSSIREPGKYPPALRGSLIKLPRVFLAARNRALVEGRIEATLRREGVSGEGLPPPG